MPVAKLGARETKNGKPAVPPLPGNIAERVGEFVKGTPASRSVRPGLWWHKAAKMMRVDTAVAGIPPLAGGEEVAFHSHRHSYATLLAQVAPMKVTQDLARHSTPVLTIGTYSDAGMAEKAEAVGRMQLPGTNPAGELSRCDLAGAVVILASSVALPVAPALRSYGNGTGRMGTEEGRKKRRKGNEETPGFPGV